MSEITKTEDQKPKTRYIWLVFAALTAIVYFTGLTIPLLGPDEPRYAAIGREMARSGDWITPRLWGEAWFEKPALLYWMTATAFRAGLGEDLAPRLPVAILSVVFLVFFERVLERRYGARSAPIGSASPICAPPAMTA